MGIFLFLCKLLFGGITLYALYKAMRWMFALEGREESRDTIGWLHEVCACPTLLIRPAILYLVLPIAIVIIGDYLTHSPAEFAERMRGHLTIAGVFLKWLFIAVTIAGINHVLWQVYVESFYDQGLMEKYSWLFLGMGGYGMGYRNPIIAVVFLGALNFAFAVGIYYQISEDLRASIRDFLVAQIATEL